MVEIPDIPPPPIPALGTCETVGHPKQPHRHIQPGHHLERICFQWVPIPDPTEREREELEADAATPWTERELRLMKRNGKMRTEAIAFQEKLYDRIDATESDLARARAENQKLREVVDCVPGLLRWMRRKNGGDPTLHSEEFYIETEDAERRLKALEGK